MRGQEELVRRLALKRRRQLGTMSEEAYAELELAVRDDPTRFVDDAQEEAFALVAQALADLERSQHDDDLLDDQQYLRQREKRLVKLGAACSQALQIDENCIDAALLFALSKDLPPSQTAVALVELEEQCVQRSGDVETCVAGDAWTNVFERPMLRLHNAIAHYCLCTARYSQARERSIDLLTKAPLDALGARLTCVLAMARLEDEDGFYWLEAREGHRGNAWFHLGRAILLYKLGRMPAARRALGGYDRLCTAGAYVLLQPVFVDTYLPDRPSFSPQSFSETVLAVHEADPIISDIPDFAAWACDQPGFLDSAQDYARRNGMEWRDWEE
ncbi:MAG: hypothetical protein Q4A01_11455 [Coriobacteriales bacterium]|nr:hypothetical protein [Coriobacteriales bacterium]